MIDDKSVSPVNGEFGSRKAIALIVGVSEIVKVSGPMVLPSPSTDRARLKRLV